MTTTALPATTTRGTRSPIPALAGLGALAAFAGAAVVFNDPLRGARTPEEAASAMDGAPLGLTALLVGAYALLAIAVCGMLAARLARTPRSPAARRRPRGEPSGRGVRRPSPRPPPRASGLRPGGR